NTTDLSHWKGRKEKIDKQPLMPFGMNINLSSGINAVEIFMSPYGYSPGWSL
ncbi:unnamed protein product, partial [Bubo scandiacus]